MPRIRLLALLLLVAAAAVPVGASGQTAADAGVPVVLGSDTLFRVRTPLGPFSPSDRAAAIEARLEFLARQPYSPVDTIRIVHGEVSSDVMAGDVVLMTITLADAAAEGTTLAALAQARAEIASGALREQGFAARLRVIGLGVLFTLLAAVATVLAFRLVNAFFPRVFAVLEQGRRGWIPALRVQQVELVSADRVADVLTGLVKVARVVTLALLFYLLVPLVLSFFPRTRGYADRLVDYTLTPFARIWASFLTYLPSIFAIGAIVVITWYLLKMIRPVFVGLARGAITVSGFYPDWAIPTYKIVRTLVLVFAFIAIWPYLPGSDSAAFRGVGVFIGLLVSLGSTSAIGNMVGGILLTYMRPFRVGDRVKIADTVGDVVEKSLLVTRVRTVKNVDVTIPNSMVLGSHIVNYSSSATAPGLVLSVTVTIGYDVPWRRVHELLVAAAHTTDDVQDEPAPFVLQTALNDFSVAYELNAYTERPNRMAVIYSDLHAAVQDSFHQAGVEIMSPHYFAARDGNRSTVPAPNLPADYRPPGFRVEVADPPDA